MKRNQWLIFISLTAVSIIVFLTVYYAGQVSTLYVKADELFSMLDQKQAGVVGAKLKLHGHLKAKSTHRHKGRLDYEFKLKGKSGRTLLVRYQGILPDTFRDGAELVIEGQLQQKNLFHAHKIFAKCPTKYKVDDKKKSQT
ncbi:MAG: cytochrome c maturation protein CcmE [Myxococcota bacterium]